jgi:predicted membrane protein
MTPIEMLLLIVASTLLFPVVLPFFALLIAVMIVFLYALLSALQDQREKRKMDNEINKGS